MKKKLLIIFEALLMLTVTIVPVSAQSVDEMSNGELTSLLFQIMQKLNQEEVTAEAPEPTPTPTPVPTETPLPELPSDDAELEALLAAIMQKLQQGEDPEAEKPETPAGTMVPVSDMEDEPENSTWKNKKLVIEALPGYMFIQPTKPSKPEPDNNDADKPKPTPVCPPPSTWGCDIHGNCMCGVG